MRRKKLNSTIALLLLSVILCACAQTGPAPHQASETALPQETPAPTAPPEESQREPEETPEPTIEPTPEATPEPVDERDVYLVSIEGTVYRSSPETTDDNFLGRLAAGTRLRCEREEGEFMLVEMENGRQAWVNSWYLDAEDESLSQMREQTYLEERTGRESFVRIEGDPVYYCIASALNCRSEPSLSGTILYQIVTGTKVTLFGRDENFYLCRLPNGKICYCSIDWLSDDATFVRYPGAVDLRVFLTGAEFDMLFASPNNITGHAMYAAIPLLEEQTAFRLLEAYQRFQEDGYTIKIYDAYRPLSAQVELYSIVQDVRFIADPSRGGSWHQRGRAVDMSLVDLATGKELEMPTPMHTFAVLSGRPHRDEWSEEARRNVDYMTEVMTAAGFGTLESEWWHFEYTQPGVFLDKQIDLEALPSYPVSDYVPLY